MIRHIAMFFLTAAVALVLQSCHHKDLCYDHTHMVDINVHFNWDKDPDADPQTMVAHFFSLDGKHVIRHEFTSRDGGLARINAGDYCILFHNGEMETVNEAMDSYHKYELYTVDESLLSPMSRDTSAPRPPASADEPVKAAPSKVWAGNHEYVRIVPNADGQTVELYPARVTARYTVEVINVKDMKDNITISGALSGLSERLRVSSAAAVGVPVTIPFAVSRSGATTLEAEFLAFGHCPEDDAVKHIMSFYASNKIYYNYDVTEQVHSAPDQKNIHIIIDGLTVYDKGQEVSPGVDDWDDVEDITINMQ